MSRSDWKPRLIPLRGSTEMTRPAVTLVAAMARDRVIGHAGVMPWHLPADLQHFKALTLGHPVVMGRKTFQSIGRALPGRLNIVISRSAPAWPEGVVGVDSLAAALAAAGTVDRVMVIGGGEIYTQALPLADGLELTLIDADCPGDTRFPALDLSEWLVRTVDVRPADVRNASPLSFVSLIRRPGRVVR